jgi:hypothetical protein
MASILRTDSLQNLNTSNIITQTNATTLTIGASGQTISIPAGATLTNSGTATGFGLTWQSVKTANFTAVKGEAYPVNTTSGEITVTLPATPSAGDQVQLVDYAGTFDTNKLIIDGNGEDIEGVALDFQLTGEREGVILTYIDSTQGWIATSGINEGTDALGPVPFTADLLVVAGGGGGGPTGFGGGGGAGGLIDTTTTITVATNYTVTIGAGGTGGSTNGADSVAFSQTAIGGGKGGTHLGNGTAGGSGGGGGGDATTSGGLGTSGQGNNGGTGFDPAPGEGSGGGGGAGAVGGNGAAAAPGSGAGGVGINWKSLGTFYAGGGGGGTGRADQYPAATPAAVGGNGGGGAGGMTNGFGGPNSIAPTAGTANRGGGGGGGSATSQTTGPGGANGGSGIVIVKYPDTFTISNPGGGLTISTPAAAGGFKTSTITAGTGNVQFN